MLGVNDLTLALFQFGILMFIDKTQTRAALGALTIGQSGAGIVAALADLGLETHGVRYLATAPEHEHAALVAKITVKRFIAYLVCALALLGGAKLAGYGQLALECLALAFPGSLAVLLAPLFYYRASGNVSQMAKRVFAVRLASMAVIAFAFWYTKSILVYAGTFSVMSILVAIVMFAGVGGFGHALLTGYKDAWDKQLLKDSGVIFITNLVKSLFVYGNAFILGAFVSEAEVSLYSLPDRIVRTGLIFANSITLLSLGELSVRAGTPGPELRRRYKKLRRVFFQVAAASIALAVLVGPTLLDHAFPKMFPRSHTQYFLCVPLLLFIPVNGLNFGALMLSIRRDKAVLTCLAAAGCFNLAMAFATVPSLHSVGMAAAVSMTEGTLFVVGLVLAPKYLAQYETEPTPTAEPGEPLPMQPDM